MFNLIFFFSGDATLQQQLVVSNKFPKLDPNHPFSLKKESPNVPPTTHTYTVAKEEIINYRKNAHTH